MNIFFEFCLDVCQNKFAQALISPVELHLSSTFPLFLNLFVSFSSWFTFANWGGGGGGGGGDHTEMGFGRNEFLNPA